MTGSRSEAEHAIELLGSPSENELRPFFGGWSVVHRGRQVGIVMDTIYAKVDKRSREEWRRCGCRPFEYEANGRTVTVGAYWSLPPEALDDPRQLRHLLIDAGTPRCEGTKSMNADVDTTQL